MPYVTLLHERNLVDKYTVEDVTNLGQKYDHIRVSYMLT